METMDVVEAVCINYQMSAYQVFEYVCCEQLGMKKDRMESLFLAFVTEDYIPLYVWYWCMMILTGM